MKNSFILVESPFQLLCANEAIKYFDLKNVVIYIRYSLDDSNDKQLDKLVEILSISIPIKKFFIRAIRKSLLDYIKIIFYSILFFIKKKEIDKLFIGNFESSFFKTIYKYYKREKIILLDDGAKTLSIQRNFKKNAYYDIFSIYKLESVGKQNIFINKFQYIKEKIINNSQNEDILFLGSKLSEIGIISEKYYLDLLTKISHFFVDKNIIYIPHRGENKNKLNFLSTINNIEIKELDYPVELYGLYEKIIPSTVVSFYSTALYTMQKMYSVNTIAFSFNYESSKYKKAIDDVYNYYKDEMKIISLKNYD